MPKGRSAERIVYFSGRFVPESQARLSIYDSALTTGDMAFEVTRTVGQRPFRLRQHLQRLFHSLAVIRVEPGLDFEEFERLTDQTLARNLPIEADDVDWNIIHNVSRGPAEAFREAFGPEECRPTVVISCFPLVRKLAALAPAYTAGLDLVVPPQRSLPHELLDSSIKTRSRIHYHLANFQASDICPGGVAILVDPDGFLTEATSGNVFLVSRGALRTPEARNILPGVTRGVVLELAKKIGLPCREMNLTRADALEADEIFVTSTSIGILHGRSFDGRPIGDGQRGPVATRLRQALNDEVGLDFAAQAQSYADRIANG